MPLGLIASVGSFLFIYGAILLSFQIADRTLIGIMEVHLPGKEGYFSLLEVVTFLIICTLVLGFMVNLNYISIHRYYRDRLMESYLPDSDSAQANETGPAYKADKAKLHEVQTKNSANSPYHIINTNLVLVDSSNGTYRMRGGDNFILSPFYCGSNATGWRPTNQFMGGGGMNLPTAMAISGAAANPNTGVGGKGATRSPMLSLLLSMLNIRLGYWISHPKGFLLPFPPNHFMPGLYEVLDDGYNENRMFLQLSDGGHFENNGLYELVRRKCKLIIICDAGADKEFCFSDFITGWERVEADFGARIKFSNEENEEGRTGNFKDMVPQDLETPGYPRKEDQFAKRSHIEGKITYSDGNEGALIFIKTTIIAGLDERVLGYKALNPDFPDESTADQFFSEEQFEAYRRLGYEIGERMIEDTKLPDRIEKMQKS